MYKDALFVLGLLTYLFIVLIVKWLWAMFFNLKSGDDSVEVANNKPKVVLGTDFVIAPGQDTTKDVIKVEFLSIFISDFISLKIILTDILALCQNSR